MLKWPARIPETIEESTTRVFAWALSIFVWEPDSDIWHVPEHWPLRSELEELAVRFNGQVHDDCDGFVSLCRCALWDFDVQSRIITCITETGRNHAVLTIERTGLVLDCRHPRVVPRAELEQLGYRWISLSSLEPGGPWTEIKP